MTGFSHLSVFFFPSSIRLTWVFGTRGPFSITELCRRQSRSRATPHFRPFFPLGAYFVMCQVCRNLGTMSHSPLIPSRKLRRLNCHSRKAGSERETLEHPMEPALAATNDTGSPLSGSLWSLRCFEESAFGWMQSNRVVSNRVLPVTKTTWLRSPRSAHRLGNCSLSCAGLIF